VADPGIKIMTAPSELVDNDFYDELDLENKAVVRSRTPRDHDVRVRDFWAQESVVRKSVQRVFEVAIGNVTPAQMLKLEQWHHDRRLLRILGNYDRNTIYYQCFQRPQQTDQTEPGAQIGTYTYARSDFSDSEVGYISRDDQLHTKDGADYPVYEHYDTWAMNGLNMYSQRTNYLSKSLGIFGAEEWAALDGAPAVTWDGDEVPHTDGAAGCVIGWLASGDSIYRLSTSLASVNTITASVWIKGNGNCTVEIENASGRATLDSTNVTLLGREWQKVVLRNIDVTSVSTVNFVINYWTVGTRVVVGSAAIIDNSIEMRHWITTASNRPRGMDKLRATNLTGLSTEGAISLCFVLPSYGGNEKLWLIRNSQDMEMWIEPVTGTTSKLYFQKKSASYKVEYTMSQSIFFPGAPIVVTATYDTFALYLYINGTLRDSTAQLGVTHGTADNVYFGNYLGTQETFNERLFWARIDNKLMSGTAALDLSNRYLLPERRIWALRNEGREFRIKTMSSRLRVGPDQYMASCVLEEVRNYHSATVEER
jgi:hypothetical protein